MSLASQGLDEPVELRLELLFILVATHEVAGKAGALGPSVEVRVSARPLSSSISLTLDSGSKRYMRLKAATIRLAASAERT